MLHNLVTSLFMMCRARCEACGDGGEYECECECRARDYSRNDNEQQLLSLSFGVGFKGERSLCNNKLRDNGDDNGASVCWPERGGARHGLEG